MLGLCTYCKRNALEGLHYCQKHRNINKKAVTKYKEKKVKARGWKMMKIKV